MSPLEDLEVYFADDGEDGTLAGTPVRVLFAAPYAVLPGALESGMSSAGPRALIASASVPASASQDTGDALLELPDAATRRPGEPTSYSVSEIVPDGTGMSTLLLRAV